MHLRTRVTVRSSLAAAVVLAAGACGNPQAELSACNGATDVAVEQLDESLTAEGTLRHVRAVQGPTGAWFVSAELLPADEDEDFPGDILTWVTPSLEEPAFEAVDDNAREDSSAPPSELDVRAEGAVTSRGCILPHRGEEPSECEAGFEAFCDE